MANNERILIAVEDCAVMYRVIDYVAALIAGRDYFAVHLYHRLPSVPPLLREHGGAEDPDRELQLHDELERDIRRWISEQEDKCRVTLNKAHDRLIAAGVSADLVHMKIGSPALADEELGEALCHTAKELGCRTIVLPHEHVSAIRDILRNRVGGQAEVLAVWLVS
ncbi:MAG: hypothetical protein J5I81_07435 [Nitrococcus mobilis]|nr:hypothetical protein [Nitrococcus mobilis]